MFDPYCPACGTRVLVGFRRLRSLDNTPHGIVLRFACRCGGDAVLVTGRHRAAPADLDAPTTAPPAAVATRAG